MSKGYNSSTEPFNGCRFSTHAEMSALMHLKRSKFGKNKYWNKGKISVDLVVLCITKTGKLRMSKPCEHCIKKLIECTNIKINYVYYSNRDSLITKIRFNKLIITKCVKSIAFKN